MPDGGLTDLDRRTEIVRLGQGVDATGEFHPDALARTFAAVEEYAKMISGAGVRPDRVHFVATSASRDAGTGRVLRRGATAARGAPDVITGDEEARLSFAGALSRVRPERRPVLVMDIGGGSTELIVGPRSGEMRSAVSLDIGSVRLTERFLRTGPPAQTIWTGRRSTWTSCWTASGVDFASIGTWIGVAGTVTTLAGVYLELAAYDRERVHGARMPRGPGRPAAPLRGLTVEQIRALPSMDPHGPT